MVWAREGVGIHTVLTSSTAFPEGIGKEKVYRVFIKSSNTETGHDGLRLHI